MHQLSIIHEKIIAFYMWYNLLFWQVELTNATEDYYHN